MLLIIDNYDSFTYNLVQLVRAIAPDERIAVRRNDAVSAAEVRGSGASHVVISPGPGRPADAGASLSIARDASATRAVLGVCLGHQCVGEAFGGRTVAARELVHGKARAIHHNRRGLFAGLPSPLPLARYHSLALDTDCLPSCLVVDARTGDGEIMAVRHVDLPVFGVQFHPESFLSPSGAAVIRNFMRIRHPVAPLMVNAD